MAPMIVKPPKANTTSRPGVEPGDLQRIGFVAEPAGQRGHQLARVERAAERDHREHQQNRREHDPRRDRIGDAIVGIRPEVLLQHHLEAVGQAVEEAPPDQLELRERNAHIRAVRADAVGHDRRLLALDPGQNRAEHQQHGHRVADEHQVDDEVLDHAGTSVATIAANNVSASATVGFFGKHGSNALTTPRKFV
jgi:hypothetical protein